MYIAENECNKKVSAIIPTYKRIDLLVDAIDSAFSQTGGILEVIVVDDNHDETISTQVERICKQREKIVYLKNNRKKGACGARNSGALIARGEYLAFLDDDDVWLPNKTIIQLGSMKKHGSRASCCGALIVDNCYGDKFNKYDAAFYISDSLLRGACPPSTSQFMIEKELFIKVGMFDENLEGFQDFDLYMRVTKVSPILNVNKVLAIFNQHHGVRLTTNLDKRLRAIEVITNKWGDEIENSIGVTKFKSMYVSYAHIDNAKSLLLTNKFDAAKCIVKSLKYNYRPLWKICWLFVIVLGFKLGANLIKYLRSRSIVSEQ